MKTWYSADYHFFHTNILNYADRPFKDVYKMNDEIIRRHNERVKPEDTVYFLGDLGFFASRNRAFRGEGEPYDPYNMLDKMNGKWYFVKGNHDTRANKFHPKSREIVLKQKKLSIQLVHNPTYAKIDHDLILAGHVHNNWKTKELKYMGQTRLIINVGVDVWNFYPVELSEVLAMYYKWKKGAL